MQQSVQRGRPKAVSRPAKCITATTPEPADEKLSLHVLHALSVFELKIKVEPCNKAPLTLCGVGGVFIFFDRQRLIN